MKKISKHIIEGAYDYEAYRQLINDLFAEHKNTGIDHSEAMLHYTKMNIARMNRLDKKTVLTAASVESLKKIQAPQIWLVLTEGWCADAAQIIPVMHKLANENPNIQLRMILRDQHLDIMDAFLTNGARSIPKLIVLNEALEVLMSWGPRPTEAQQMMLASKEAIKALPEDEKKVAIEKLKIDMQKWYNRDKTVQTQEEILAALNL
ncbi:MAG: thioredoxin family protein [Bacteroidota bacterium]